MVVFFIFSDMLPLLSCHGDGCPHFKMAVGAGVWERMDPVWLWTSPETLEKVNKDERRRERKRRLAEAVNSANFRFAELTLDKDNGHL